MALFAALAAPASALSLFAAHEVTVQLTTADGKPMADAEVRVFAPGDPNKPVVTGRIDHSGKFVFEADRDGFWSAEARDPSGEIVRVMVRVGGVAPQERVSPFLVVGGLAVLLVIAVWYRLRRARARARARRPPG